MSANNRKIGFKLGFTLLELIVALALMDMIALVLYSSLQTGFRAKKTSRAVLKPYKNVTPVFEFFRRDICSAVKPDGILAGIFVGEDNPAQFSLNEDVVSFYTCSYQPDEEERSSNIINVQYALEDDKDIDNQVRQLEDKNGIYDDDIVLKRFVTKNILAPNAVDPEEEILCRGILGLNIEYYNGEGWLDDWDSSQEEEQLPWAVRVTLTVFDPGPKYEEEDGLRDFSRVFLLPFSNVPLEEEEETETEE